MVGADVEWFAGPADGFDGFHCEGRLGLLLGPTFLAVERRIYITKKGFYDELFTTPFRKFWW